MFPVPKGAHIDKFSMEIGGKMVDAELLPADKARQIYEDIVRKMRDPALLEYAGRDMFKVRIFPIEPRKEKQVKITYFRVAAIRFRCAHTYLYPRSARRIFRATDQEPEREGGPNPTSRSPRSIRPVTGQNQTRRRQPAVIGYESKDEKPDTDFQLVFVRKRAKSGSTV